MQLSFNLPVLSCNIKFQYFLNCFFYSFSSRLFLCFSFRNFYHYILLYPNFLIVSHGWVSIPVILYSSIPVVIIPVPVPIFRLIPSSCFQVFRYHATFFHCLPLLPAVRYDRRSRNKKNCTYLCNVLFSVFVQQSICV